MSYSPGSHLGQAIYLLKNFSGIWTQQEDMYASPATPTKEKEEGKMSYLLSAQKCLDCGGEYAYSLGCVGTMLFNNSRKTCECGSEKFIHRGLTGEYPDSEGKMTDANQQYFNSVPQNPEYVVTTGCFGFSEATPEQEIDDLIDETAEEYQFYDHVLPSIDFGNCVSVSVDVSDEEVSVNIGGRIIVWERGTGELVHSGAYLDDGEIEEIGSELGD